MDKTQTKNKLGRPKNPVTNEIVDEVNQEHLDMENHSETDKVITIDEITTRWKNTFSNIAELDHTPGIGTVAAKWNKLNPFLQNERIKNLYTRAKTYNKANINQFLTEPGNHEQELRSLAWVDSSSQQIYYNILRHACDIPLYNYFVIPDLLEPDNYKREDFMQEDQLVQNWLEMFNVKNTFKTIALEVKREGKSTYLLRNKFVGKNKTKAPGFCTLQKLPTDWIKITGKGQLGYTVSFNMMYFLNIANSPSDFGDFIEQAWADMTTKGVIQENSDTHEKKINLDLASQYYFVYNGQNYSTSVESIKSGRKQSYMFWLRMPYDICYTFSSDNSQPWVAPDTMGLMVKLQELTDFGQLAGLIASTPLTAVLTGEIETIPQPRAGKNESVYSPEVLKGYMEQFNAATSTNIEAWLWPAKNIKLQQLSSDVNSSEIINTATRNFLESAGESGLTVATDKPNVAQVNAARQLAASQQEYVTIQFEQVLNFILKNKLGLKYYWKVRLWGDIFNQENDKKYLKEIVANGNLALLPKLMSAEHMSIRDTKAVTEYINTLDFYKNFLTYTSISQKELNDNNNSDSQEEKSVGRPSLDESDIDNEATAASRDQGTNTSDNRE